MTDTFESGRQLRSAIMGEAYVENALADPVEQPLQELLTEFAYGAVWARPDLGRRERSMITIAMLCALNRPEQLKGHVAAALKSGVTRAEVREILLHSVVYCGAPASIGAFRAVRDLLAPDAVP